MSRHRIRAYVGVPLRTSREIVIGTLCALDYRPRAIPQEFVRVLELFARRVVAELERPRGLSMLSDLVVDPPRGFILRRPFFEELLSIELARLRSEGRSTSLLIASGCPRERQGAIAGLLRDDEVAGELTDDTFGVLLSKSSGEDAKARCAALTSALKGEGEGAELARSAPSGVAFAPFTPDGAIVDAAGWIEAARAASLASM